MRWLCWSPAACSPRAAAVQLVAVEGGGHNWYATEFGPADGAIDATTAMLEFFGLLSS